MWKCNKYNLFYLTLREEGLSRYEASTDLYEQYFTRPIIRKCLDFDYHMIEIRSSSKEVKIVTLMLRNEQDSSNHTG